MACEIGVKPRPGGCAQETDQDGRYRKRLQRLLKDVASGTVFDPTGTHHRAGGEWDAAGVKPMLEYYMGQRLPAIEEEFQQFIRRIALEVIES